MDGAGLAGQACTELRIWSGNRLEVRVLSPALCRYIFQSVFMRKQSARAHQTLGSQGRF